MGPACRPAATPQPSPCSATRRISASTPEFQVVEHETAPRLAAFRDRIAQNEALFRRIAAVYEARERAGLTPEQTLHDHRASHFTHVFSGDGYAAGYYSYIWADVLAADAWAAFAEAGGPWDKAVANRLRECVFSVGNTTDPADGYRRFRGRDARLDALMRERGLPVPAAPPAGPR